MFSKLIINKYQDGKDTQTTEIIFREHIVNGQACRETVYGTWRIGEVLQPIKEQRLFVNIVNDQYTNEINFKAIACHIDGGSLETSSEHSENCDTNYDNLLRVEGKESSDFTTELKNKRKIDKISEFLIKKANGEVQIDCNKLCTDILDKNLGKICKNNEIILRNIFILNEKLEYLKKKEIEETTVARLANVSHVCDKCGSVFSKYATFQYHMKTHRLRGDAASKVRQYRTITRPVSSKFNPVWVCPFCYQAWPNQKYLQEHLFTSQCNSHQETDSNVSLETTLNQAIKRHISQLMHCEFCEKIFTNITKVLKHQKEHRSDKNYQCTTCNYIFNNYTNVVQHWSGPCLWKKHVYVFTQPTYLICNICYEKFESWDNLYVHRYEYEHFISKCKEKGRKGEDKEEESGGRRGKRKKEIMKYLSVVQCEVCAEIYGQQEALTLHREEVHLQKLCQICGHISACKQTFLEHMKNHNYSDNITI